MAEEKRLVDGYEIIQTIDVDRVEIVVGENLTANKPYLTWRRSLDKPFGAESHMMPVYSGDYLTAMREFTRQINAGLDALRLDRAYRAPSANDAALTAADCVEGGMKEDLRGKVVVIKPEALLPEYRVSAHQLVLVTGGFGCAPDARGRTVYGTNVYSGTSARWNREDILGVAAERAIPEWARRKLEAKAPVAAMRMDKDRFWQMIDNAREKAGCWQGMYEPLKVSLSKLGPSEILRWQQIFREYHDLSRKDGLWAAVAAMQGGCSDDSFDYFRGWLIAQGKETFLNALAEPDSLADLATMRAFAKEISASKFTPLEGYYEEPRFESMLSIGVGDYDFYRDVDKTPLSTQEKAAIAGEIRYAADIDVRGEHPKLNRLFSREAPERGSVLEKIREGGNTEHSPPKKPHNSGPEH